MDKLADVHGENDTNEEQQHQSAEEKKKVYKPYMMTRDKKLETRKIQGWIHRQKFEGNYLQPKIQLKTKQNLVTDTPRNLRNQMLVSYFMK